MPTISICIHWKLLTCHFTMVVLFWPIRLLHRKWLNHLEHLLVHVARWIEVVYWTGIVDWKSGLEKWTGIVDWKIVDWNRMHKYNNNNKPCTCWYVWMLNSALFHHNGAPAKVFSVDTYDSNVLYSIPYHLYISFIFNDSSLLLRIRVFSQLL